MSATIQDRPAVLLTHGFWHGAWCWTSVATRLTVAGRRVLAVDMAGHGLLARRPAATSSRPFDAHAFATEGSPIASIGLSEAADLLTADIRALAAPGPIVLVAHSFGGVVATRAAQQVPDLIAHLVYVSAIMPASGVTGLQYLQQPEQSGDLVAPLLCGDPSQIGALRLDTAGDSAYRRGLRAAFYADLSDTQAQAAISLLTPDAPAAIAAEATTLTAEAWGAIPRTYVLTTQDFAARPALQRRFIADADAAFPANPTTVVEIHAAHAPFLSQPDRLAKIIDAAPTTPRP